MWKWKFPYFVEPLKYPVGTMIEKTVLIIQIALNPIIPRWNSSAIPFVFFCILTVLFHLNFVWFYQSISFVPLGKKGALILHLSIQLFLKRDFDQFKIVLVFLFTTSVNFALTVNVLHSSLFIYVKQQLVLKQN